MIGGYESQVAAQLIKSSNIFEVHSITLRRMEKILCSALFGAFLGGIVTILYLKLWKNKERVVERGRRRPSGFNNPPEKQPVENDERPAKMPQEHEERF